MSVSADPILTFMNEKIDEMVDPLELLGLVREDLSNQLAKHKESGFSKGHILVSVVGNGVFVSAYLEYPDGRFVNVEDFRPDRVYELYLLKKHQYSPAKGAWFSVKFVSDDTGTLLSTKYDYDRMVYETTAPDGWYGETVNALSLVWTEDSYRNDLKDYPRPENRTPEWLR